MPAIKCLVWGHEWKQSDWCFSGDGYLHRHCFQCGKYQVRYWQAWENRFSRWRKP